MSHAARVLLLPTLLLLASCGGQAESEEEATQDEPRRGGTLVIAGPNDIDHANSLASQERWSQEINRSLLFLPLIRYDEKLGYEPALARSWELLGDTGVVFRLRDDVRWHDSVRTTAYDVEFTYDRAKNPETAFPNASYFEKWGTATVQDSFTIRFSFQPHDDPLAGWPFLPIMPHHKLGSVAPARLRNDPFNRNPVGNGPFRFVSAQANDRWIFEANPDFPQELGGRPYLDRVVWRIIPDNTAQVTELRTGNADLILAPRAEQFRDLDAQPDLRGIVRPGRQFAFIGWNGKRPPLNDPRVRRAVAMATDRRRILNGLRAGLGDVGVGPIAPYHWAFDRSLEPLPFDRAAARTLLAEAGYKDTNGDGRVEGPNGRPLTLELKIPANSDFNRDIAELVRADLDSIGVRLTTRPEEFGTIVRSISSPERTFDAVLMAWESDFRVNLRDVYHTAEMRGPFQMASYSNPEVDRLIDETSVETDREKAKPLYHRLQRILLDEQPWTVLYYYPDLAMVRERVRGVEMDIRGAFVGLPRWWLAEGRPSTAATAAGADSAPRDSAPPNP